ncbi:MAG: protein kinase, partial [Armatimonadetes bacterium]|nr:protein kinase [Armatimonadota bacterium]
MSGARVRLPLGPGTQVTENIRLVRELGRGGMGSVWIGHDARFDNEVAVKFVVADLLARFPQLGERFKVEARAAAQIRSPHVVQILDHGLMADGTPYMVMERLHGESLAERLKRGRPTWRETAIIVAQTAKAL